MPPLTGRQNGTPQSDAFIGDISLSDLTGEVSETGLINANINARSGNDRIEGQAILTAVTETTLSSTGISQLQLEAGAGEDRIIGIGRAERLLDSVPTGGFGFIGYTGSATGYGLLQGSLYGRAGNDSFLFSGIGNFAADASGIGVSTAFLSGGLGNDSFSILGEATGGLTGLNTVVSKGLESTTLQGNSGEDNLAISVKASANDTPSSSIGVDKSLVNAGIDDDTIAITVESIGRPSESTGIFASQVYGGSGKDSISVSVTAGSATRSGGSATGIGVDSFSQVNSGEGDDAIAIDVAASGGGRGGGGATSYGIKDSRVNGGGGNDTIVSNARTDASLSGPAYGAFNAEVKGGAGDDTIRLSGRTFAASGPTNGVFQSQVLGGAGDDTMLITVSAQSSTPESSIAAVESTIRGGAGDDAIKIETISGVVPDDSRSSEQALGSFDIQDSLIFGDGGDDRLDVGIGTGTVRGGAGNDLTILNYFDAETMEISALSGGIQITGTQTKLGKESPWTQKILEVESYQVGSTTYTAETISDLFAG